jgi:hypothetical protein
VILCKPETVIQVRLPDDFKAVTCNRKGRHFDMKQNYSQGKNFKTGYAALLIVCLIQRGGILLPETQKKYWKRKKAGRRGEMKKPKTMIT